MIKGNFRATNNYFIAMISQTCIVNKSSKQTIC